MSPTEHASAATTTTAADVRRFMADEWRAGNIGPAPCIVDDEGGVCGRDECPRCGDENGRKDAP